jgi:hypothetical protein
MPGSDRGHPLDICSLAQLKNITDERMIWVRGALWLGAHEVGITDEHRCPKVMLFLEDPPGARSWQDPYCAENAPPQFSCPPGAAGSAVLTFGGHLKGSLRQRGKDLYGGFIVLETDRPVSYAEWLKERPRHGP